MAHTNQTPNYGLSQFEGTDKPAWLVDYNGDNEKIDLGIKEAKDVADTAKAKADQGAIDIAAITLTANAANTKATEALSNFSDVYDATATYNLDDVVLYEGLTYRCTTSITVPEPFDGTHWTRATVEDLLNIVNTKISALTNIQTTNVTPANTLSGSLILYKRSGVCHVRLFDVLPNQAAGWHNDIATIPTTFRPDYLVESAITSGTKLVGAMSITTDGSVSVYLNEATTSQSVAIHYTDIIYHSDII